MLFEPLAHGHRAAAVVGSWLRSVFTPGGGRGTGAPNKCLHDKRATLNRRGSVARGGDGENAALAENPPARRVLRQRDAAHVAAVDTRNAVVPREPLVHDTCSSNRADRRRCGPRARHCRTASAFPARGPSRRLSSNSGSAGCEPCSSRRRSHCPAKFVHQLHSSAGPRACAVPAARGPWAGSTVPLAARSQQCVVRDAAPEEERQTRGQLDVADAIDCTVRELRVLRLDAIEELRIGQQAREPLPGCRPRRLPVSRPAW